MKYYLIAFAAIALAFTACKSDSSSNAQQEGEAATEAPATDAVAEAPNYKFPDLEGKQWLLTEFEYDGNKIRPVQNSVITLRIVGDKATGSGGCNEFNAKAAIQDGSKISFAELSKTKKLCTQLMTQETWVLELLETAQSYQAQLALLEVNSPKGKLTFRHAGN
jgi:heat shock protein HslJ